MAQTTRCSVKTYMENTALTRGVCSPNLQYDADSCELLHRDIKKKRLDKFVLKIQLAKIDKLKTGFSRNKGS